MELHIANHEAARIASELAHTFGITIEEAVLKALREEAQRTDSLLKVGTTSPVSNECKDKGALFSKLMEIGRHCAHLPVLDGRSAEEIIGYDENGLPT